MCSSCGSSQVPVTQTAFYAQQPDVPCDEYNYNLLTTFYNKLNIVKNNGNYVLVNITETVLNSYIGYVISALNYNKNYCFFKDKLDEISQVIVLIDAL